VFITNRFKVQGSRFRVCNSESRVNPLLKIKSSFKKPQSSVLNTHRLLLFMILLLLPHTVYLITYTSVADAATVTLAWDKNSETDIAGYRMHYGTTRGSYSYNVDIGNSTSCTISGLTEGKTYYFAATAYNSQNKESGFSKELACTIATPPSPPTSVDNDNDGILDNDETDVYGTDPQIADTDGDGITDGDEIAFWSNSWNADYDADGIINLLDADSDNDEISDGLEISQGTDPGDQTSTPVSSVVFAVNTGGPEYVGTDGTNYRSDSLFSGGTIAKSAASISGTTDDTLYQSERYGNFSYRIPVANGNYLVTLKFAEFYWSGGERRVFDVEMEGNEVISDLDVFAKVGKYAAYDVVVPVSVADGLLNIDFYTDKDNAKVGAIVVVAE
jgi:hypothetical protein